jgi:uncharacterized membrane protein required for colicin V production
MDTFSVVVYEKIGGSPMVVAFLSFIILLGLAYAAFKLMGIGLAKIVNIQRKGKKDQMGGAFIGFARGWIVIAFVFFLLFLLPMPASFYLVVEDSLFGPSLIKTIPFIYESSSAVHPNNPSFYKKVESTLMLKNSKLRPTGDTRAEVELVLLQIERFFSSTTTP